ncbi:hypothetical protein LTS18_000926 [Coniosporium uncinatum]|uniref:Uncharacterized protein n=1 Tax=Coniosporium uncinatum TaxID=93489 RepID=A0ACC3D8F8_9PEZI|nr:hypothetical protein LTS18_000926 [Coniosporium uncinatum]
MAEDVGELGLEGINKITDKYFDTFYDNAGKPFKRKNKKHPAHPDNESSQGGPAQSQANHGRSRSEHRHRDTGEKTTRPSRNHYERQKAMSDDGHDAPDAPDDDHNDDDYTQPRDDAEDGYYAARRRQGKRGAGRQPRGDKIYTEQDYRRDDYAAATQGAYPPYIPYQSQASYPSSHGYGYEQQLPYQQRDYHDVGPDGGGPVRDRDRERDIDGNLPPRRDKNPILGYYGPHPEDENLPPRRDKDPIIVEDGRRRSKSGNRERDRSSRPDRDNNRDRRYRDDLRNRDDEPHWKSTAAGAIAGGFLGREASKGDIVGAALGALLGGLAAREGLKEYEKRKEKDGGGGGGKGTERRRNLGQ